MSYVLVKWIADKVTYVKRDVCLMEQKNPSVTVDSSPSTLSKTLLSSKSPSTQFQKKSLQAISKQT